MSSTLERIARDMAAGTFPKKSDETLREEADGWYCVGCGKASPNRVRSCDCPTSAVAKDGVPGSAPKRPMGWPENDQTMIALAALAAEDARQTKLHELLETIREQIRLEVAPEHRPEGLFKNIQDAVYAMRGRTALLNDAAITAALTRSELDIEGGN